MTGVSGRRYRVDNVLRGTSVIVEYDGRDKYGERGDTGRERLLQEKRREDDLREAGYAFVRVTIELLRRPVELDRSLRRAVAESRRSPSRVSAQLTGYFVR